jgi:DNA-binding LacI/PurR family transcriptional regulator
MTGIGREMADIFFSYKREDRPKVERLVHLLEGERFTVWWDAAIETGEHFSAVIREQLDTASCVIVGWSATSVKSSWVLYEASAGRARDVLVPVSLDGTKPPLGFQQYQTQDLSGWEENFDDPRVQRLFAGVHRLAVQSDRRPTGEMETRPSAKEAERFYRHRKHEATRNKRVFLIAASTTEEWQLALNNDLILSMRRSNLSCTVLVPSEDHFLGEHQALQREVLADAEDYSGGIIIISGWPEERTTQLIEFAKRLQKPLVFVDHNPSIDAEKEIPWNMSYVSISDSEGGRLAADAALEIANERPIGRILILSGFAKQKRYEVFRELISKSLKCDMVVSEDGKFDRWISENVAYNKLNDALRRRQPFDVIFCTADSMTLGCLDAIDRIQRWHGSAKPRVIGYDGTVTTQRLADSGRSFLARIVVQDTKELARASVEQLVRMRLGEEVDKSVWVKPYLFPRISARVAALEYTDPVI